MTKMNRKALLQKNPQVDGRFLAESERKITEARKLAGKRPERPVAPPYGGRRLIPDTSKDGRAELGARRSFRTI
jgi:hypothetical protein